jgi:hypothetical protein
LAGHQTDPIDRKQIAEYAYRYQDELASWQPREEILHKDIYKCTQDRPFVISSTPNH